MPISAEKRKLYPADWPEIREKIRQRAGNRCEWCGIHNHAIGYRRDDGSFRGLRPTEHKPGDWVQTVDGLRKIIKIVCTTAHVENPDPADCRNVNLAFLCQRCHNRHDARMRAENAAATRAAKADQAAGVQRLFNPHGAS